MTTLLLVRHGETVDNAAKIMQGQTPGKLNETGVLQAEDVRDRLRNERIDAFVSSDLHRSVQTCKLLQPLIIRKLYKHPYCVSAIGEALRENTSPTCRLLSSGPQTLSHLML